MSQVGELRRATRTPTTAYTTPCLKTEMIGHQGLRVGKLPPNLLERLLAKVSIEDPRVLVGGRVGEDAAVIDMGDRVLVAKTDPITFASDLIGWYAVQVNANDVACMGAKPRWFLATILLPEGAEASLAESVFSQVVDACQKLEISLVGGHTEVTHQLQRPMVIGLMLGETERERVVLTSGAQPGDAIILTKGIAIEGTAVLAREAAPALKQRGVTEDALKRARNYLFNPGISVVREALAALDAVPLHSMHDPTEGWPCHGAQRGGPGSRRGSGGGPGSGLTPSLNAAQCVMPWAWTRWGCSRLAPSSSRCRQTRQGR